MFRKISNKFLKITVQLEKLNIRHFSEVTPELITYAPKTDRRKNAISVQQADFVEKFNYRKKSVLEKCDEDVSHVAPYLKPTFNVAAYINKSETLQQLVKLNVDLFKLEKNYDATKYILGLDFEKDVKNHIIFLNETGLDLETIGKFITKNPFIFKEEIEDLKVRISYLLSKKFNEEMVVRIIGRNPFWLSHSTKEIDEKLGFFQNYFSLTGNEVRALAVQQPKLITYNLSSVKANTFTIKEEMGFNTEECKSMILSKPNLLLKNRESMLKTFDYLHTEMEIPLETLAVAPEVITCRVFRLKQRHEFLKFINKAQYNPKKEGYVSILTLVAGSDEEYCSNVAKCPLLTYTTFLKTL